MIELEPDAIRVFEQDRVIAGAPTGLARGADDVGADRIQETVEFIDVGALAGAEAEMMQADAVLLEGGALMFRQRRADRDVGAAADGK
jgi:hypothetical protein